MALFKVSNNRAQFDAAGNEASDQYGAGIRFTQGGNARVTTGTATNYNQGIPMSATGQVAIVDATAGLPAGTIFHNGLPMSGDKVCVSRNATAVVSNGLPFDSAGAVAADVNFDLNFIGTNTLNSSVTFTRASTATYFDSAGVLPSAAINAPRFDYNPSTLAARGLLIEEQRTNSIRNNTMQGAVAGTPGTAPTNWIIPNPSNGLSRQIVGTGTENGITYVDVRYSGTTSAASLTAIYWEAATQVAAASGQAWTNSVYVALVGGSTANTTGVVVGIDENNGAGGFLTGSSTTFVPSAGSLTGKRVSHTRTLTNASTAFVWPYVFFTYNSGVAIDITLRIGLPQLEQGAFATSVIPTTTTALTRSADVASVNTLSPWYNATEGTLFVEAQVDTNRSYSGTFRHTVQISPTVNSDSGLAVLINTTNTFENSVRDNAVTVAQLTTGTNTGVVFKYAGAYKVNDFAFSANGGAPATDTSGAVPTTPAVTQMKIGGVRDGNALGQLNGYLRRITYYPRRLSNAELQAITA